MNAIATKVLDAQKMRHIITRMAYEIQEQHYGCVRLVLLAINGNGSTLGQRLLEELHKSGFRQAEYAELLIDKQDPVSSPVKLEPASNLSGAVVVLVDDVLNTGKTLIYGLKPLLGFDLQRLQVAVLVDRGHHHFPVGVTFCGYQLATTLQEHIRVSFDEGDEGVYLH
jgi:pyrimidine operon attenuation protein/uracil phosphoribosyltransferase